MKLTLPPAYRLDWGVLASRLGVAVLLALLSLLTERGLPHETRDLLAYSAAAVGAALTALPSALQASGLVRPVSPGFASLCERLGHLVARPGVRAADVQAAVSAEVQAAVSAELRVIAPQLVQYAADEVEKRKEKTNMGGFSPAELGQKELGQKEPDGPNAPPASAAAPAPPVEAVAPTSDSISDSIAQTGGNQ